MRIACALAGLLVAATGARGQVVFNPGSQQRSVFEAEQIMRVTVPFRVYIAMTDKEAAPHADGLEAARREIYVLAAKECAVIAEIYKGECRLNSISFFGPQNQLFDTQSANVVYEIRIGLAPPGR